MTTEVIEMEPPKARKNAVARRSPSGPAAAPVAGPMGNALAFIQAGGTMEQLRDMLALQQQWEAGEARKAFVQAMTDFKAEPLEIFKRKQVGYKTADGGFVGYKHAELADVADVVVPAMAKHGLSHRWDVKREGDRIYVTCVVMHRLGHSESITMDGAPDNSGKKNAIQQQASTITYLQRYTLLAATGLATKEVNPDDDGAGGGADEAATRLQEWTDKANAAVNLIALSETRKMAGVEFNAAKDVDGWNAFKDIVEQKRRALTGGAAQ